MKIISNRVIFSEYQNMQLLSYLNKINNEKTIISLYSMFMFSYPIGDSYYGEIIDNLYNGHGVFIYLNGSRFEGKYNEGIRSGFGTLILNQIYGEVLEIYCNNWDDIHLHSPARIICNRK